MHCGSKLKPISRLNAYFGQRYCEYELWVGETMQSINEMNIDFPIKQTVIFQNDTFS